MFSFSVINLKVKFCNKNYFFDLQLVIKHKCRRLLSNVTLDQHDLELSSFPLEVKPV